jgi:RpiB/LacA/LacB family sugar-phosphate isomerase
MKYNLLLPIAGLAKRFMDAGYNIPKPLIMAHNKHIIDWALSSIDTSNCNLIFIVRLEHIYNFAIDEILMQKFGTDIKIVIADKDTEGSVCTCLLAKKYIDNDQPLLIYTPDVYFEPQFNPGCISDDLDGLILTFMANNPAHSYARTENGRVIETAEKRIISNDAAVGVYYFRTGKIFVQFAEQMIAANDRVNSEFYICPIYNYMIRQHPNVIISEVPKMHVLGTPSDLDFFVSRVIQSAQIPIALCADHSGFELKEQTRGLLEELEISYLDFGTYTPHRCDYYDFVHNAAKSIQEGLCQRGFGFCRTGQGVNIAANKHKGINAALIFNEFAAQHAVSHNAANFFTFPSLITDLGDLTIYVKEIMNESFDGGRHFTRIKEFYNV